MAPTYGELFLDLWRKVIEAQLIEKVANVTFASYAIGFQVGQAEKVYSGACEGFMIRPGADWWVWAQESMTLICAHYGLKIYTDEKQGELWSFRNADTRCLYAPMLEHNEVNSPAWHRLRAYICGIRSDKYDDLYHEREGFGARCEPEAHERAT